MTFKTAVDNLAGTYEKYGFTREEIEELLKDGIMNQVLFGKLNAAVSIRLKRVFQST